MEGASEAGAALAELEGLQSSARAVGEDVSKLLEGLQVRFPRLATHHTRPKENRGHLFRATISRGHCPELSPCVQRCGLPWTPTALGTSPPRECALSHLCTHRATTCLTRALPCLFASVCR